MKKTKANTKKLLAAISVSIFSLAVCFSGVYAWFTTRTTAKSESTSFKVYAKNCQINELNLYKFEYGSSTYEGFVIPDFIDLTKGKVTKYTHNGTDFVDSSSNTVEIFFPRA